MRLAQRAQLALVLLVAAAACVSSPTASPTETAAPSPTSTPLTEDEIVEAFLAIVSDDELTFHSSVSGTVEFPPDSSTDTIAFGMEMDVSGEEGFGQQFGETSTDAAQTVLISSEGSYWHDVLSGTWRTDESFFTTDVLAPLNPFQLLVGPVDLSLEGREERGGAQVYHLLSDVWLSDYVLDLSSSASVEESQSDIFVDASGSPIAWEFHGVLGAASAESTGSVSIDVAYEFSRVGAPVEIPTPDTPGDRIHWTELREGDCFNFRSEFGEINDVDAVPCAEAHVHEVFWVGLMPSGDPPSDEAKDIFFNNNCLPAFESYVGREYDTSVWYATWIGPSEGGWSEGERAFLCHLFNSTETPVTGSARGSGQ